MKKIQSLFALLLFAFFLTFVTPAFAEPKGPKKGEIWICPSVSTNNPHGMWVIGGHGAYYIIKPSTASHVWQGSMPGPMDDILNPTYNLGKHARHVEDQAQVNASWGLYHKLPSYPYLNTMEVGAMAMVLEDGAYFINDTFSIWINPMTMVHVMPYAGTAWYNGTTWTLYANVTLAAAVFW